MRKKVVLAVSLAVFAAASILMVITSCAGKSDDASVIKAIKVGDYQEENFDWKSMFGKDFHLEAIADYTFLVNAVGVYKVRIILSI